MSNVALTIGGRNFAVACEPGQENHIAMLGRLIDDKLHTLGGAAGQSESRILLFAALVLADELHDARKALAAAENAPVAAPQTSEPAAQIAGRVEELAARIENLASHLEEQARNA